MEPFIFSTIMFAMSTGLFAFSARTWRKMYLQQREETKAWKRLADENLDVAHKFRDLAKEAMNA